MRNNLPAYITEDYDNADFILFLDMIGQHFDILWVYINGIKKSKKVERKGIIQQQLIEAARGLKQQQGEDIVLKVVGVIRKKIMFSGRPTPLRTVQGPPTKVRHTN